MSAPFAVDIRFSFRHLFYLPFLLLFLGCSGDRLIAPKGSSEAYFGLIKGTYLQVHPGATCPTGEVVGFDWKVDVTDPASETLVAQSACSSETIRFDRSQLIYPKGTMTGFFVVQSDDARLSAAPFDLVGAQSLPQRYTWEYCENDMTAVEIAGSDTPILAMVLGAPGDISPVQLVAGGGNGTIYQSASSGFSLQVAPNGRGTLTFAGQSTPGLECWGFPINPPSPSSTPNPSPAPSASPAPPGAKAASSVPLFLYQQVGSLVGWFLTPASAVSGPYQPYGVYFAAASTPDPACPPLRISNYEYLDPQGHYYTASFVGGEFLPAGAGNIQNSGYAACSGAASDRLYTVAHSTNVYLVVLARESALPGLTQAGYTVVYKTKGFAYSGQF